ncbi:ABC transporter ATP-binding protein [Oscillospiraceae bacterium MB08-C2-2]|nr:ABC transporter ATP-binding protein [Oscillospiraceae bacterium MB08-C2-2]
MKLLEVKGLHVHYGNIHALKDLSLEVEEGEIVALIGANGAGKTTLMTAIMSQIGRTQGEIHFMGKSTEGMPPAHIVRSGMTMVPEGRRVFPRSSVLDNLLLGAYSRRDKKEIQKDIEGIFETFPQLGERKNQLAGTLSGGEQQMLAMGRALMSRPKLLMLDEPSMGLAPIIAGRIFKTIRDINHTGTTVLLVEQNANQALRIANRGYVVETGEVVLADTGKSLLCNQQVRDAYLGS